MATSDVGGTIMLDRLTSKAPLLLLACGIVSLVQPADARAASCTDEAAVAAARSAIEATCPCPDGTDRRAHLKCASDVTKTRVSNGSLPKACAGGVKRCAKNTSCGKPGMTPCCTTNAAGRTTCKITTPDRCTARGGCTSSVSSCCDACGPSGCTPVCGNGVIEASEQCDGEAFCNPVSCTIPFRRCCQVPSDTGFCSDDAEVSAPCSIFGEAATTHYGTAATGTSTCSGFPYAELTTDGACGAVTAFPSVPLCCDVLGFGNCSQSTAADSGALAQFQRSCSHTSAATTSYYVSVGTCGGDGYCVPAH